MKAFLQNEIQLFFDRKNYLVWIVGALAVVFAYRFYYVTQYENYAQTVLEELEENAKDITIWESEYQRQCMELWGDNSAEKFAHASLLLNAWKQYEQTNIRLRYYWEQAWDEKGIRRTVLEEDENLIAIEELGEEVEYTGIFRGSVADWRARMLLHKAYQQSGTEEPVCPVVPQAAWLWKEAFSGNSVLFLIFTVLIILLHFFQQRNRETEAEIVIFQCIDGFFRILVRISGPSLLNPDQITPPHIVFEAKLSPPFIHNLL